MTSNIIWKLSDNSLKVTVLPPGTQTNTALAHRDELIARGLFNSAEFISIVDSSAIPQDRYFRDAWIWDGAKISFDLVKCRQRHINKLRKIRDKKLSHSDADFMQALEQNDQIKLEALKAYRQSLRDMPQAIATILSTISSPDAIKDIRPSILDTPKP